MPALDHNPTQHHFAPIDAGFARIFAPDKLSVGLGTPIETYTHGPEYGLGVLA